MRHQIVENVNLSTSIKELPSVEQLVTIFPNPLKHQTTIKLSTTIDQSTFINILNSQGQLVFTKIIATPTNEILLQDLNFPPGIYTVQLINQKDSMNQKIIIH